MSAVFTGGEKMVDALVESCMAHKQEKARHEGYGRDLVPFFSAAGGGSDTFVSEKLEECLEARSPNRQGASKNPKGRKKTPAARSLAGSKSESAVAAFYEQHGSRGPRTPNVKPTANRSSQGNGGALRRVTEASSDDEVTRKAERKPLPSKRGPCVGAFFTVECPRPEALPSPAALLQKRSGRGGQGSGGIATRDVASVCLKELLGVGVGAFGVKEAAMPCWGNLGLPIEPQVLRSSAAA